MGIHASTQHNNPAAFVFLTYKLQNDPSENLLPQHTGAPPRPSLVLMDRMCVLCVNVCSLCVSVFVCEQTEAFTLALELNRKRGEVSFFVLRIFGSGGQTGRKYHTVLSDCCWSFLQKEGV